MKALIIVVALLLVGALACAISFTGTGDYEYEFQGGEPDTNCTPLTDSLPPDSTDENMDDEFDLLDDGDL